MPARHFTDSGRTRPAARGPAPFTRREAIPAILATVLLLASCDQAPPGGGQPQTTSGGAPPPPEVDVVEVTAQNVPLTRELVGRLAAGRVAEVRARVAGIILKQVYTEGTDVKAGDVLFRIDPAPLEVVVLGREAELVKARADADNARDTARRFENLNQRGLTSRQDLDNALAAERSAEAAVKIAEASLEAARLDLGYATVRAPIAGRAGRARVNEGALVGQDEATALTTVEQIDPIRVNFSQSLAELEQLSQMAGSEMGQDSGHGAKVDIYLPSGRTYPHQGSLDFTDLAVDPGTGAVSLRAVVPNPGRRLLPGMFVKLRLTMGVLKGAYIVPQASVLRDVQGAYVMSVDAGGNVLQMRVDLQAKSGGDWVTTGDLQDGDRVIVSGLQKVRPGGQARIAPSASGVAAGDGQ
jgi:membrane fusion protein (multidrug efflux system)